MFAVIINHHFCSDINISLFLFLFFIIYSSFQKYAFTDYFTCTLYIDYFKQNCY